MTKLIIVRHCQAEGNLKRLFQGRTDCDITPKGRAQIGATAEMLSAEPIDVFYTSSLIRAQKIARGINVYHDVPIITDDRLIEIDPGKWEGQYLEDIAREYPKEFSDWNNDPAVFQAPEGESMSDVYNRVSAAVNDIVRDNPGKTVCIVSHGCTIKTMMCYLHGWQVRDIGGIPLGTNMSVNVAESDDRGGFKLIMENYCDHLALVNNAEEKQ